MTTDELSLHTSTAGKLILSVRTLTGSWQLTKVSGGVWVCNCPEPDHCWHIDKVAAFLADARNAGFRQTRWTRGWDET